MLARRVRRQVLAIVDDAESNLPRTEGGSPADPHEAYWLGATRLEALVGLADDRSETVKQGLFERAPEGWMPGTTTKQLDKLRALL